MQAAPGAGHGSIGSLGQATAAWGSPRQYHGMQHRLTNHNWQCESFFKFGAESVYI
jgi:hypothetical protein